MNVARIFGRDEQVTDNAVLLWPVKKELVKGLDLIVGVKGDGVQSDSVRDITGTL